MTGLRPELDRPELLTTRTSAAVLVLHGGAESGLDPVTWRRSAVLRMLPFARAIRRAVDDDVAVLRLRYRVRGWNADAADPLADARWALDEIRSRTGGAPVVPVGHSMGGRVAIGLLGEPETIGLVGLAPWVEPGDEVRARPGQRILLRHAVEDRTTAARATMLLAARLDRLGADVDCRIVRGDNHAMLRHPGAWHRETAEFVEGLLRC